LIFKNNVKIIVSMPKGSEKGGERNA
jgi:hypothetical protein